MDMFRTPWAIAECDGIFLGNILHTYDDDGCRFILEQCRERLLPGGRVFVHEVLWNDDKVGPLIAALLERHAAAVLPAADSERGSSSRLFSRSAASSTRTSRPPRAGSRSSREGSSAR